MFSEEEKKAIKTLKEVASDDFDTLGDDISPKMAQNILNLIEKQQEQIKSLKDENDFLRFMYKGTDEYKAIERYANGDHIPRID